MKAKIITAMIFSAMLLSACNTETPIIDDLETSASTVSQEVQTVVAVTTSEVNGEETSFVVGGSAETTVTSAETVSETENAPEPAIDFKKIDVSGILKDGEYFNSGMSFFGDIAAVRVDSQTGSGVRFFDINDLTVMADIDIPIVWEFDGDYNDTFIEGSGDVLCKVRLGRLANDETREGYTKIERAVLNVHKDFTAELDEGEPRFTLSFPAGSHNISDMMYDIVDADSGAILVEGFQDTETELGFDSIWYDYRFAIDSERFVYRVCGNERMPGFGYYDFEKGQAVEFPESKNLMPVGHHNGKVYAEDAAWDGMSRGELYAFDMETLESEHIMSSPAEVRNNSYTEYYMPEGGSYIIAIYYDDNGDNGDLRNIIFMISADSGEVLTQQEFGSEYSDLRFFTFIEENKFAAFNYNTKEIVVFDVTL